MKKLGKSFVSFMLVLVMLLVGIAIPLKAADSAETLIQRDNEKGTQVDGSSRTGFSISVNRDDDEFDVYRIAEMSWDASGKGTFKDAAWVEPVKTWIASSAYAQYSTPALLGEEKESVAIAMLRQLKKSMEEDSSLKSDMQTYKIAYHEGTDYSQGSSSNVVASVTSGDDGTTFLNEYTVNNVEFGLYYIDAKNSSAARTYQPLLADVTPTQTGPTGNWYYEDTVAVTLKYQDIIIDKYINATDTDPDKKTDIVRRGQKILFEINSQIPQYPSDGKTHTLYMNDIMAGGFTLDDSSIKLQYSTDDGATWNDIPETGYYTRTIAADAFTYSVTSSGVETEFAYAISNGTNYTYYTIKDGEIINLGNYADTSDAWSRVLTAYNDKQGTKLTGTVAKKDKKNTDINYNFTYDKLMTDLNATDIKLTYNATVNNDMVIGSDSNTNEVSIYYIEDSTGKTNVVTDVVKAWTYAVNIVKVDGDTVKEQAHTYLGKAEFDIYRRSNTYCSGTSNAGIEEKDHTSYTWFSNQDGLQSYTEAGVLEKLSDVTGKNIYKIPVKVSSCANNPSEHYHIEVFEKFNDESIVSTADKNGYTFKGLDPNAYIIVETKAPDGYNILTEAVRFEINKYNDSQYKAAGSTYKGFIGDDSIDRTDGIYPVQVMNFKGVTLPSTGGMGTWLFIIVGISVMIIAMICVVISRRKQSSDEC